MDERVKEQFNSNSSDYDSRRRMLIPLYDEFYNSGIDLLSYSGKSPKVLDIGAGTGIFSEHLLSRYKNAKLTLIDFAESMMDIAKEKFEKYPDTEFIIDDYTAYDFGIEKYDIVLSSLSIHHLTPECVKVLYGKIYGMLTEKGEVIIADISNSGISEIDEKYDALWTAFVSDNIGGETEFLDRFQISKGLDRPHPVREHISWLEEAGFEKIDCVFRYYNFSVFFGEK